MNSNGRTSLDQESAGVQIRQLSKIFGRGEQARPALVDIDLSVAPGEFVCLVGPSGCGKSTLLKIIAGLTTADTGSLKAGGREVRGPDAERCMIFQAPTLFPWLSTLDNVLFGPRARHMYSSARTRAQARDMLQLVGLGGFEHHYPHQLSGGMQHRVAFARALINRPSVLLMDEPFGALDAITRHSMQEFLLDLWQRHKTTIVFVTHDVEEATLLADRVCVMSSRPGRILAMIDIGLGRPRAYAITETVEFVEARRVVRSALDSV